MTDVLARDPVAVARRTHTAGWLAALAAAFVAVRLWGLAIVRHTSGDLALGAIPFFGAWDAELTWRLAAPLVVAGAAVALLPIVAGRSSWRGVLAVAAGGVVLWSAALTLVDRPADAWGSIDTDYGRHVDLVHADGYGGFLRDYVEAQYDDQRPTHLRAHPPGLVLALAAIDDVGVRSRATEIALAFAGAAAAGVAALVVLDDVAGRAAARRALPFVVLAPAAVWHANADALYAGSALVAVALVVKSTSAPPLRRRTLAAAGGALFGVSLLLSYGVVLLAVPVVVVAVVRHRLRTVAVAAVTAALVVVLPAAWGYSWFAGWRATKVAYDATVARLRPYSYFVVANLVVLAMAIGPAIVIALTRLRDRAVWLVTGSVLAAVAVADLSGLTKAETERIWQPFLPLVLASGLALRRERRWLALQASTAVVLAVLLRSPW